MEELDRMAELEKEIILKGNNMVRKEDLTELNEQIKILEHIDSTNGQVYLSAIIRSLRKVLTSIENENNQTIERMRTIASIMKEMELNE